MDWSLNSLKVVYRARNGHCAARGLCRGAEGPPSFRAALVTPSAGAPSLRDGTLCCL